MTFTTAMAGWNDIGIEASVLPVMHCADTDSLLVSMVAMCNGKCTLHSPGHVAADMMWALPGWALTDMKSKDLSDSRTPFSKHGSLGKPCLAFLREVAGGLYQDWPASFVMWGWQTLLCLKDCCSWHLIDGKVDLA